MQHYSSFRHGLKYPVKTIRSCYNQHLCFGTVNWPLSEMKNNGKIKKNSAWVKIMRKSQNSVEKQMNTGGEVEKWVQAQCLSQKYTIAIHILRLDSPVASQLWEAVVWSVLLAFYLSSSQHSSISVVIFLRRRPFCQTVPTLLYKHVNVNL